MVPIIGQVGGQGGLTDLASTAHAAPEAARTIGLSDVVAPLSVDEFVDKHWLPGTPHLGRVSTSLVDALAGLDALDGPEALLLHHRRDVRLFGPNGERLTVPAEEGLDWLQRGYTLYVDFAHRTVPEAHQLMRDIATDMGFEPWQLTMEAFAGVAGAVSTRHFDHDVTIQILLDGDKDWTIEPNEGITNPFQSFHPPTSPDDTLAAFGEEVYADDLHAVRSSDPKRRLCFRAGAGSSVFVPRGWWHETRAATDTWSVNLVFHSISWARALGRALEMRLHADPRFRAYCGGVARPEGQRTAAEERHRSEMIVELRSAAVRAIDEITGDEVPLAMLGFIGRLFRWSPAVTGRRLVASTGGWDLLVDGDGHQVLDQVVPVADHLAPAVDALCQLTSHFRWDHLTSLLAGGSAAEMHALVSQLTADGAIEVVHAGLGT